VTPTGRSRKRRLSRFHAQAFGALVGLGFKESVVRRALEQLRRDGVATGEGHEPPLARLMRAALAVLTSEPLSRRGADHRVRT
jgi:hypothetical protein